MVASTYEDSRSNHMLNLWSSFKLGREKKPKAATYPPEGTSHLPIYYQFQRESQSKINRIGKTQYFWTLNIRKFINY